MTPGFRLVISSILMSFVEMMLIRWTGSNIYSLFFFANFILIASFLGIGIGFLRLNENKDYFKWSPLFLALVVLFCYLSSYEYQIRFNASTHDLSYYNKIFQKNLYPVFMTLPLIFVAVTLTMASLADGVARQFKTFTPLSAYRLEVLGTLFGIMLFAVLGLMRASPISWGAVIALLYGLLFFNSWRTKLTVMTMVQVASLALLVGVFYKETITNNHFWSTYYKIQIKEYLPKNYVVNVNGLAQQIIEPIEMRKKTKPFYMKPYEHMVNKGALDNVLVIGAGTGGDVAIALAEGAKHIDAVEIDRKLYLLGKKLNPSMPYQDPRVSVYIDDGRAFLQKTKKQYDLIIYALTDSLMLIPGQSSMRLENYLYTLQGMEAAKNHLAPNGVFTLYNYYGLRWFADRMANTLQTVYGKAPCFDTYSANHNWATVLTTSKAENVLQCPQYWQSKHEVSEAPATDNHPFIYLEENKLTPMYIVTLIFIGLLSYYLMRKNKITLTCVYQHFDLFLMGAAFLLLETKSVINYALLFGTTWMVNSLVFIGILGSVYAAIEVVRFRFKLNVILLYGLLIASLVLAWYVPLTQLLSLPWLPRFLLATLLTFTPIFMANLIFAERFYGVNAALQALGANLLGAVLGGLLEYLSLILGYQHFALFILAIYLLASIWLLMTRQLTFSNAQ